MMTQASMLRRLIRTLLPFILVLAIWSAVWIARIFDPFLFPNPLAVFEKLLEILASMEIFPALFSTVAKLAAAIGIGASVGFCLGFAMSRVRILQDIFMPLLDSFRSIPATALFPLFMLALGNIDKANLGLAVWICVLYVGFHTAIGFSHAKPNRSRVLRRLGIGEWDILRHVEIYEAMPHVFVGLRVAFSLTLVVIILAEMFVGSEAGLGKSMLDAAYSYNIPAVYAIIILIGCLGMALNSTLIFAERKMIHWKED